MKRKILLLLLCVLCSCATLERMDPVSNKFLEDVDVTKKIDKMPFQHSWVWQQLEREKYPNIYIAPVSIANLDETAWKSNINTIITSKEDYLNEAQGVADFFQEELIKNFENYPGTKLKVVKDPSPEIVTMAVALTELQFAHPVAQAGALASPVPGTGAALSSVTTPKAAFALKMSVEGEEPLLVATAADRKFPPIRLLDLNKLTVTRSVKEICSSWAEEIAEAVNKEQFEEVESRGTFSISPW